MSEEIPPLEQDEKKLKMESTIWAPGEEIRIAFDNKMSGKDMISFYGASSHVLEYLVENVKRDNGELFDRGEIIKHFPGYHYVVGSDHNVNCRPNDHFSLQELDRLVETTLTFIDSGWLKYKDKE